MKVLALNSSARTGGGSKTELMLNSLVQGMREAGADVEAVELRKKNVGNCLGCFSCWTKTPGVCIQKDDMTRELYPKWKEADLAVYATPLYHYTVNASMKAFIERTLPVLEPFLEERDGKTFHPLRHRHPKIAVLSVAGFPEMSVFDQLSSWANIVFGRSGALVAEIYRPMAESMTLPFLKEKADEVLQATVQAGRELVETMRVSAETLASVTRPLAEDPKPFFEMANVMWKTCIAEGLTPKELAKRW